MNELKAITAKQSYKTQMNWYRSELRAADRNEYARLINVSKILVAGRLFHAFDLAEVKG